jgi:hypothetical protein
MNKFEKLAEAKKTLRDVLKDVTKEDVLSLLAPLFEQFPKLMAVRWRQYTPYFNDGDPCRFSVHDNHFKFDDTAEEDGDYEDGFESYSEDPDKKAAMAAFDKALSIDKDVMEKLFGDPVEVTIDRNGVEVEEHYQG